MSSGSGFRVPSSSPPFNHYSRSPYALLRTLLRLYLLFLRFDFIPWATPFAPLVPPVFCPLLFRPVSESSCSPLLPFLARIPLDFQVVPRLVLVVQRLFIRFWGLPPFPLSPDQGYVNIFRGPSDNRQKISISNPIWYSRTTSWTG